MPAIGKSQGKSKRILTILVPAVVLALAPGVAQGAGHDHGTVTEGTEDNQTITAKAGGVSYDTSNNGSGPKVGPVSATSNWSPPPCWYTPTWDPQAFKDYVEGIWGLDSTGYQWDAEQRERYEGGKPYKDFNLDKAGKGYWWTGYTPEGGAARPGALDCNAPYFWVDTGDAPPADIPNVISPEILAQLAYAQIRVPDTDINLNPAGAQTVNLSTWAWLDGATFKPVSVTATADLLGISATTTATPVALHIEPGTADADLYPASGDCPIVNGHIGTAYVAGSGNAAPPCGLVYRHATGDGTSYPLRATVTWKVSWTGSGGTGDDLPDGTFGHTTDVTVREVQTINR